MRDLDDRRGVSEVALFAYIAKASILLRKTFLDLPYDQHLHSLLTYLDNSQPSHNRRTLNTSTNSMYLVRGWKMR
jgi:hypothetical protein